METGDVRFQERTLYEVLNVARDATQEEISEACVRLWSAYRSRSNSPILKEILVRIDEAHRTLGDSRARAVYDARLDGAARRTIADAVRMQDARTVANAAPRSRLPLAISLSGAFAALMFTWIVLVFGPEDVSDAMFVVSVFAFLSCAVTFLALMLLRWALQEHEPVQSAPRHAGFSKARTF